MVSAFALVWLLSQHSWPSWRLTPTTHAWMLGVAAVLLPINLGLEMAKWRSLTSESEKRPWMDVGREVMVGQTWAFLGPLRVTDGAGRMSVATHDNARGWKGAKRFGFGALAQGWATWCWAIPAAWLWNLPMVSVALSAMVVAAAMAMGRTKSHRHVMILSLVRYGVFALQYLCCLLAFGALTFENAWGVGFPRISAVWCAISIFPWPAELGVREAVAAWAFDANLPSVVAATFVVWLLNRAVPALGGWACLVARLPQRWTLYHDSHGH